MMMETISSYVQNAVTENIIGLITAHIVGRSWIVQNAFSQGTGYLVNDLDKV